MGLLTPPEREQPGGMLDSVNQQPTKEDQGEKKMFVLNGMRLMHGPETRDTILQRLGEGDPTDSVAETAYMVLERLEQTSEEQGKPISDMTKVMGGNELVGEVIATGEAAGIFKMSEEERALSFQKVIARVLERDIQSGKVNPQELQQAGQKAMQEMGLDLQGGAAKMGLKSFNLPGV